jgi:toxin-antitoxin system PIN domain toxin
LSFAIDVNILLYASDAGSPLHARAARFLEQAVTGGEVCCLAWITLMSYVRMATHPAIFGAPLTHEEACRNVAALIEAPHVRVLNEESGFWDDYRTVCAPLAVRGNLVPDAHLATILRQHGVKTLWTHDRDFRKFDFLNARDPLAD